MKTFNFSGVLVLSIVFLLGTSCGGDTQESGDSSGTDENEVSVKDSDRNFTELKRFAATALADGKMEIELSQTALENSPNAGLKRLARSIKEDHEKANRELEKIIRNYDWDVSTEMNDEQERKVEKLREVRKDEKKLNRTYLNMMISSHQKAIREFEEIAPHDNKRDRTKARSDERLNMDEDSEGDQQNAQDPSITEQDRVPPGATGGESKNEVGGNFESEDGERTGDVASEDIPNKEKAHNTYREGEEQKESEAQARYADNVGAPELKRWAANILPKLRDHLKRSEKMLETLPKE